MSSQPSTNPAPVKDLTDPAPRSFRKLDLGLRTVSMERNLNRTLEALKTYDLGKQKRQDAWEHACTPEDVTMATEADDKAVAAVRAAFAADTQGVNSADKATLVHPDDPWLRRACEKFARTQAEVGQS